MFLLSKSIFYNIILLSIMSTFNDLKASINKIENKRLAYNIADNLNKLISSFNTNVKSSKDEEISKSSKNKSSPIITLPSSFQLNLKYPFNGNSFSCSKDNDESLLLFNLNSGNSNQAQKHLPKSGYSSKVKKDSFNLNVNANTNCVSEYVSLLKGNTNISPDVPSKIKGNDLSLNLSSNMNIFDTFNNNLLKSFGIESQGNSNGTLSLKDILNQHI